MPVSKRDKKVSLTKTSKKGMKLKQQIVEDIRKHLEEYHNLFVFNICNMRHGPMNELREKWKGSRFFLGKRKVMAIALGRTKDLEVKTNLHKVASYMSGDCGLLFTNEPKKKVIRWFEDYSRMDYAKAGHVVGETVVLPKGPLNQFSFSIEPHLRSLGLPTQLQKGVIELREDYTVCVAGARLTPEQAQILKLFGMPLTEFRVKLVCVWSEDGSFEKFKVDDESVKNTSIYTIETSPIKGDTNENLEKSFEKSKKKKENQNILKELDDPIDTSSSEAVLSQDSNDSSVRKNKISSPVREESPKQKLCSPIIEEKEIMEQNNHEDIETDSQNLEEKQKSPKKQSKTPKKGRKTLESTKEETEAVSNTPALLERLNLEETSQETEENVETMQVEPSPKLGKGNPRRSMRTPKPIKRTPEQRRQSVKKLTEPSNTPKTINDTPQLAKSTTKKSVATPKKSVATPKRQSSRLSRSLKPKEGSEDVEMS